MVENFLLFLIKFNHTQNVFLTFIIVFVIYLAIWHMTINLHFDLVNFWKLSSSGQKCCCTRAVTLDRAINENCTYKLPVGHPKFPTMLAFPISEDQQQIAVANCDTTRILRPKLSAQKNLNLFLHWWWKELFLEITPFAKPTFIANF